MKVTIMDYRGEESVHDIGAKEDIACVLMQIITGDETLIVIYKDGHARSFDSSDDRFHHYFDGQYIVYCPSAGIDHLSSDWWNNRSSGDFPPEEDNA